MRTEDLKLGEINIFLELSDTHSVRELARRHGWQPGQISKLIRGLESKLGMTLVERSNTGVRLTPKAVEILPFLREFQTLQQRLSGAVTSGAQDEVLGISSTSYFSSHFVPAVISKLPTQKSGLRMRLMDLTPTEFVPLGLRGAFQFCIHLRDLDWPKTWTSVMIGEAGWHLCARRGHPVLAKPTLREILKYPFVYPAYWTNEGVRYGDDHCPVPIGRRIRGHETSTAVSAREIVKTSDHLGFLPELVARQAVLRKEIEVIELSSWKPVKQPVYLSVKNDIVKQRVFENLRKICARELVAPGY